MRFSSSLPLIPSSAAISVKAVVVNLWILVVFCDAPRNARTLRIDPYPKGVYVHFMMAQTRALHFLVATAFVFVNLLCPCVSVAASAQSEEQQHHQLHEMPADSDCQHQQCPDCNSEVVISGDQLALVSPSPGSYKINLDDDDAQDYADLNDAHHRPRASPPTGPPYAVIAFAADSPVRRHDLQLK